MKKMQSGMVCYKLQV